MKYRPEIDGLRALAVTPVILFHAGFKYFSGGFVGVDVFFVISGYLITAILIEDIESGRFNILSFYERRVRRILPALFFVMLVCIPLAWMWMLPAQMKDFSQSLVAVSLFASNILFWQESGYFSAAALEKPLLHTWSLAVEEQYYVLFPIFLLTTWRYGRKSVFWAVVALALASVLLSEWGSRNEPIANFYFAPTRAWELLFGSISAFIVQKKGVHKNDGASILGLVAILFSIFVYDEKTPFPSIYTLIPVLGTVLLIIFAEKKTLVAKLLSTRIFVGMGLLSYSAYLWHQPIFAFARIFYGDVTSSGFIVLLIVILLASYFSWAFIEKPFRKNTSTSRVQVFLSFALIGSVFITLGLFGQFLNGFGSRINYPDSNKSIQAIAAEWDFRDYPPHPLIHEDKNGYMRVGEVKNANLSTLFIGDSHAYQYWHTIADYVDKNSNKLKATNIYLKLLSFNELSVENLNLPSDTNTVALSYFWALRLNNPNVNTYIRCCGNGPGGVVGQEFIPVSKIELDASYSQFETLLKKLKRDGVRIILVLDNPFGEELNAKSLLKITRGLSTSIVSSEHSLLELSKKTALERRDPTSRILLNLAKIYNLEVIDPFDYLCKGAYCFKFGHEGYLKYKDYDHLSLSAVKNEGRYINQIFSQPTTSINTSK